VWDLIIVERMHNCEPTHSAAFHGVFRRQDRAAQLKIIRQVSITSLVIFY
jgi:hypothetical protein